MRFHYFTFPPAPRRLAPHAPRPTPAAPSRPPPVADPSPEMKNFLVMLLVLCFAAMASARATRGKGAGRKAMPRAAAAAELKKMAAAIEGVESDAPLACMTKYFPCITTNDCCHDLKCKDFICM